MKNLIILSTIVLAGFQLKAQQEHSFTNYFEMNSYFNPAATGTDGDHNITGLFRKQWVGFAGTPMSGGVLYDKNLNDYNMGVGGFVFTDFIGALMTNSIVANYRYTLKLNDEHNLAFGLDAGVDIATTDYDRLVYWDNDVMFDNQKATRVTPHIGTGVHYFTDQYYVGISIPRLVNFNNDNPIAINAESLPQIVSNYYLTAGYKFDINDDFKMQVNLLGKYTPRVLPQGDLNVMCTYNNMIGLGIGYKSLGFGTTFLQYTYDNVVTIGYAFDFTLSEMSNYSSGSHEILIKYRLPSKKASTSSFN